MLNLTDKVPETYFCFSMIKLNLLAFKGHCSPETAILGVYN